MPNRKQRRARSLNTLHKGTAEPQRPRFRALDHANVKLLLTTDPARALDGFKAAQVGSLMQWPYYERLKAHDPEQARVVRVLAAERGIPETLEKRP